MSAETTHRDREQTGEPTERVTVRVPTAQLEDIEALVEAGRYPNRSEAIRAAIGQLVASESEGESDA